MGSNTHSASLISLAVDAREQDSLLTGERARLGQMTESESDLSDRIQQRCIEAAWLKLAEIGLYQVTLEEIANQAQVSTAELEDRLGNIQQIRTAIYQQILDDTIPILEKELAARDPASLLAMRIYSLFKKAQSDILWSILLNQFCAARYSEFIQVFQNTIGSIIEEGARKGQFTIGPDQAALDMVVGGLLAGLHRLENRDLNSDVYIQDMTGNILRSLGMFNRAALERAICSAAK